MHCAGGNLLTPLAAEKSTRSPPLFDSEFSWGFGSGTGGILVVDVDVGNGMFDAVVGGRGAEFVVVVVAGTLKPSHTTICTCSDDLTR